MLLQYSVSHYTKEYKMTYTAVVPGNTPTFSMRLPPELRAELQKIADAEDRPLNYIIIRVLREYVANQKQATASQEPKAPSQRVHEPRSEYGVEE
jgi:hypothetical protein